MSTHDIGTIIEALEQYTRGDEHQRAIEAAIAVLRTVESRESALIAERDALRTVGAKLANMAFNLAQYPGEPITQNIANQFDQCRREWDAIPRALSAPSVRVERDALRASLPQWISITDARKPAFRRPVLVRVEWSKIVLSDANEDTYEHGVDVTEGEYCPAPEHGSAYFESYQGTHHDSSGVTHWMELPSATLSAPAVEGV